jgi:hypothetical protein
VSSATPVVRRALLIAATPLLLGTCGSASHGKVATVADQRGQAGIASPQPPPVDVTVLEPGDPPRAPLRYHIRQGQSERLVLEVGVQMKLVVGEMTGAPRYTVRVTMDLRSLAGSPRAQLEGKITKVEVPEDPGIPPATVAALRSDLDRMNGLSGSMIFTDVGHLELLSLPAPADATPQLINTLDWIRDALRTLVPPLPLTPVGKNARWQVRRPATIATAHIDETTVYKLSSAEGRNQLAVTVGLDAREQPLSPGTPPGTVMTLTSFEGGGKGQIDLALDRIVQPTTLRWAASGKGTATPAGEPQAPITLGLEASVVMKRM